MFVTELNSNNQQVHVLWVVYVCCFSDNFETPTLAKLYVAQVSRTATDDVVSFYFLRPDKNGW